MFDNDDDEDDDNDVDVDEVEELKLLESSGVFLSPVSEGSPSLWPFGLQLTLIGDPDFIDDLLSSACCCCLRCCCCCC